MLANHTHSIIIPNNGRITSFNNQIKKNIIIFKNKSTAPQMRRISTVSMTEEEAKQRKKSTLLPTSPHVTIYKFPLPAISSITNRATGVALYLGIGAAGIVAAFNPSEVPIILENFKESAGILVPVAKGIVAFPFVYHYSAGIRHLIWDSTTKGLDLDSVYFTTKIVIGVSAALTLGLAVITI